ncbi:putative sodium-coupled neutral amino acid transporter 7 isoform X2 [Rhipicephalus sanguineus]|uniref:putative sodium-coupled neutral amino acid transporter 7 isoform X2 n=1 Tax=Rhipicephalus sanguineus TaxID=34632 RepID=UPI001893986C|nr:putative sodium-coupled neutral amino acid transporter 7 isoform X2 [Rhipicephalus sanguineus]
MPSRRKGTVSCSEAFASTAANGISAGAYYRRGPGGNFIQDSFHSSTDMPTYIAWQTLSTDLSERMRQGSVRLSRTNTLEYAPIAEDDEKTPLLNIQDAASFSKSSVSTPTVEQGVAWTVAAFLLVNSALGAGVLNYPAAYDRAGGILAATLLQILMICLNVVTMLILGYCADLNGDNTFHDVLLTTCGRRAQQIAAASILLSCYGVCITFLIVIGDQYDRLFTSLLGPLFCHEWYLNRQFTTCATAVLFILPLCYFQRLDFLKYARPDSLIDLVVILPVICFAYQAHEVVVPIYANMRDRRLANLAKATILTTAFLFIIYTLMGTFGYMAYGSVVKPDIMQMFDASNPWVLFGIVALIVKMVTTYPLLTFCGRGAFDGLYAEFTKLPAKEFIKGESRRRIFITTGWFLTTVGFATFTSNVGVVIDLLGCLAAANIFIFPGLCLLGVFHQQEKFGLRRPMVAFAIGAVMVVIGSFIFGVVLLNTIMHDITEGDSHHLLCT